MIVIVIVIVATMVALFDHDFAAIMVAVPKVIENAEMIPIAMLAMLFNDHLIFRSGWCNVEC